MAKGRQTKTLARISLTGTVVDLHGHQVIHWSVSRPLNPGAEKMTMLSTYNGNMQDAMVEVSNWLDEKFPNALREAGAPNSNKAA